MMALVQRNADPGRHQIGLLDMSEEERGALLLQEIAHWEALGCPRLECVMRGLSLYGQQQSCRDMASKWVRDMEAAP